MIQWKGVEKQGALPFKFNHHWINEPDFKQLVVHSWSQPLFHAFYSKMDTFSYKMKRLKGIIKAWIQKCKEEKMLELRQIEVDIAACMDPSIIALFVRISFKSS